MRTTRTRRAAAAIMAGALVLAIGPAPAQALSDGGCNVNPGLLLRNYKSNLYLQPYNDSNDHGIWLEQWPRSYNIHQLWCRVTDGEWLGYENAGSRKNLGINYASSSAGAWAIQAWPTGALNQDWIRVQHSGLDPSIFSLRNRNSGMCLGIDGASTNPGAHAMQFPCDGKLNQLWQERVPS
ncbi:RICIN domain-containing protein [Nonomuraea gerenzanensis]|uniref:Ricin B lectin domain-containing protein n=1 Tax=Nonomuraea gerenzanensis TaxID=93944 RepID=A0A1M4EA38_9ACTN|nr:RICIN domain-containing protein [Nonomuraea gerenzanensis]UBU17830.1 RICIN domain-containing protein [Nonomuraea gerenzanensis]SBO95614.1 hypothetical protein BN4615_P5130 [Nonomuraea gerenzanensis]